MKSKNNITFLAQNTIFEAVLHAKQYYVDLPSKKFVLLEMDKSALSTSCF